MVWTPSGIVTLLTDFGTLDPYVGIMKGVLLSRCDSLRAAIDLTHAVPPQDTRTAAFHLAHAWRWFPEGSVHVAVVDPGVGSGRAILVALDRGHAFIAPDNGLLGPVLTEDAVVRALDVERFALPNHGRTFHGRDVFAPAAAAMAGGVDPASAGSPAELGARLVLPAPRRSTDGWSGEVLFADRFGNLVTNVSGDDLEVERAWEVVIRGRAVPLCSTYADAPPGELCALVDSFDVVEVARSGGSAAEVLGCSAGEPIELRRRR